MTSWSPDVNVDEDLARELLKRKFPGLPLTTLRLLGSGWDNQAYLVNEAVVFRIPHRKMGGELMELECAALSWLNQQALPLEIPVPKYVAPASSCFPYAISGYPIIKGRTADSVEWKREERALSANQLGRFLSALHQVPANVDFAIGDKLRRADLQFRLPIVLEKLKSPPEGLEALLRDLAATPAWDRDPVWVHGDLYSRHLIVDSANLVCGVIDWGDAHVGDPALDLAIAWMFLPPTAWPEFIAAYGGIDSATWRRARFRAITHWVYLREYAESREDANLLREFEFLLENVTQDASV